MYDAQFFLDTLKGLVANEGGEAIVTIVLRSGAMYYIRDVIKTHGGYVDLNVWHNSRNAPIQSPSSDAYSQEIPAGYHAVSVSFESISHVNVMGVSTNDRRRIGFYLPKSS